MGSGDFDVAVVGAGIVGLATSLSLLRKQPGIRMVILEKEDRVAPHQSSHNSGVIHSGIYYKPGSDRAVLCREGRRRLINFAEEHGIVHRRCGKLVVATREQELPRLQDLYSRARKNGIEGLAMLSPKEAREVEPSARCLAAMHVPGTEIVDYQEIATAMASDLTGAGVPLSKGATLVQGSRSGGEWSLKTSRGRLQAKFVINCAGLQSDRIARMLGTEPGGMIIPFRGDYFRVNWETTERIRGLIYPVPDPELPFLGVHITPTVHRGVLVGPNALLALAREGYGLTEVSWKDTWETLSFPGFPRFLLQNSRNELRELSRSASLSRAAREVRRMIPTIDKATLTRGPSGIRAQYMGRDGTLYDDFVTISAEGALHVLNAPSPAATASLAIGERLADTAATSMG